MPEAINQKVLTFLLVNPGKQLQKGKLQDDEDVQSDTQTFAASLMHVCIGPVLPDNLQPELPKYLVAGFLNEG